MEARLRESRLLKQFYNAAKAHDPALRQKNIAFEHGVSQSVIASWLNGHTRCPDQSLLFLGERLGFDPEMVRPTVRENLAASRDTTDARDQLRELVDKLDQKKSEEAINFINFLLHSRR